MNKLKKYLSVLGISLGLVSGIVFADDNADIKNATSDISVAKAEVLMVLDKSGSMYDMTTDTIGGFNTMIHKYKEMNKPIRVSTVLFNNQTQVLHDRQDIASVKDLTTDDYVAQGSTALLDALGQSITKLSETPDIKDAKDTQVVVVIITDGQENSSREYSKATIKKMISDKQEKGWKFLFLGANIDAVSEAGSLGIDTNNAVKYKFTGSAVRSNFKAAAAFTDEAIAGEAAEKGSWKNEVEVDDGDKTPVEGKKK